MKAVKFLLIFAILSIIAAVAFLYSSLNDVVKKGIETVGSDILGVQVTVNSVDISLKEGSAQITGLNIKNPSGYKSDNAFSLGKIRLAIDPSSITTDVIRVKDITIVSPKINYELANGKTNINVIKNNIGGGSSDDSGAKQSSSSGKSQKSFIIDNIVFTDGSVNTYIAQLEKSINLPEIKMQNIGSQSNPASAKQVATVVISKIVNELAKNAKLQALTSDIKDAANAIKDKVKNMGSGIKGMLGGGN